MQARRAAAHLAPDVIRSNKDIELWALECASVELMLEKESELNTAYKPEWTKEVLAEPRATRLLRQPPRPGSVNAAAGSRCEDRGLRPAMIRSCESESKAGSAAYWHCAT
jgi:hypothetical protein